MVAYMKEFFWIYQYETVKHARFIPLRDFYFSGTPSEAMLNQYDFKLVIIFLTTGLLILFMAVFNYVSMSLAQTSYRAKEMATRRLLGSSRPEVFWRMIAESFILTLTSFVAGFLMAKAVEPKAMELLNVRLDLAGDLSAPTVLAYIALTAVLSLLAGFVPATILSNYNPMDVVKGTFRRKTKAVYLRMLNIVQCGLTAAMLACSLYLSIQIYRILHAPLGYEYGHVLIYEAAADRQNLQRFRDEVKKLPYVKRVSFSQGTPHNMGNNNTTYIPVADSSLVMSFQTFVADSTFFDIYHIRITEDRHTLADEAHVFLSEKAMKDLESAGLKDYYPVGNGRVNIAGVFKDFHIGRSLIDNDIHPLQIMVIPSDHIYPWNISVEVQDGDLASYQKETDRLYSEAIGGINKADRLIVKEGYVVTSLFGSSGYDFVIPAAYHDLPIIGIHYRAYETLKSLSGHGGKIYIRIGFYGDSMAFVMPPHRYNGGNKVKVDYYGESHYHYVNRPSSGRMAGAIKNCADTYYGVAFTNYPEYGPLADLAKVAGTPVNGYSFYSLMNFGRETFQARLKIAETIGTAYYDPEEGFANSSEATEISLIQSTPEAMKMYGLRCVDGCPQGKETNPHYFSFEALKVGKAYSLPRGNFAYGALAENIDIRQWMDKCHAVLAFFRYRPSHKTIDIDFAYNLVPGEEEVVDIGDCAVHRVYGMY